MGNGTSLHLYAEVLQDAAGIRMTHVPYRGAGPAFTDLVAGRIQVLLAAPPTVLGAVRGGQVRVLAIGTRGRPHPGPAGRADGARRPASPSRCPTGTGCSGRRGWTRRMVARLLDGVRQVNALPEVQARFAEQGGVPRGEDGAALADAAGGGPRALDRADPREGHQP